MILVDTSVWVEVFRKPNRLSLEQIVDLGDVVVCLPIVQEVLQGFDDGAAFRLARESMLAFPMVEAPMPIEVWLEAAQLFRTARTAGVTIRAGVDCLIAACALRHDLEVLHRDRDFDQLARITQLRARQP